MCGFSGIFLKNNPKFQLDIDVHIHKMNDAISHRGPDGSGVYFNYERNIALGHRRLSVIDLSNKASQPMNSENNRWIILFNGEIYNHIQIKNELKLNYWKSTSDTEVLLEACSNWGLEKTLKKVNGMFSFVLWDKKLENLFLITDHIAKKPIYWLETDTYFAFASELKSLMMLPDFKKEICREAVMQYLYQGYISAPHSIYKNIFKMKAKNILKVGKNSNPNFKIYNYGQLFLKNQLLRKDKNQIFKLEQVIAECVKDRLMSDVPIGCFVSGGVDSALVAYYANKYSSKNISTFTASFNKKQYDESIAASKLANYLKTNHYQVNVDESDIFGLIRDLPRVYDEPFSDPSQIPLHFLSKSAKKSVKVILTGDGGDEFFGGYRRHIFAFYYNYFKKYFRHINLQILSVILNLITNFFPLKDISLLNIQKLNIALKASDLSDLYFSLTSKLSQPEYFDDLKILKQSNCYINLLNNNNDYINNLEKILAIDHLNYLPNNILVKTDRMSMSHGLEVRNPLLDIRLINFSNKISLSSKIKFGVGKIPLRDLLKKNIPNQLISKRKHPFLVPISNLLRHEFYEDSKNLVLDGQLIKMGFFSEVEIEKIFYLHKSGKRNYEEFLWNIYMFENWIQNVHN